MSDFEHFAAFFGNLYGLCHCHNGFWDLSSEPSARAVARLGAGTLRHPDNNVAASGAGEA